jgi:elongin-A
MTAATGPLYMGFIKRDIPQYDRFELPPESDCTYELYSALMDQIHEEVEADAVAMAKALNRIDQERAQHSSKFITDPRSVHLPKPRPTRTLQSVSRMGGMKPRFATATTIHGKQLTFAERSEAPRESAKKNSIFTNRKNKALAVPTHRLNSRASQITHVPKSLVEDHKRPPQASSPPPRHILAPRTLISPSPRILNTQQSGVSLEAREARLRALTTKNASSPPTSRPTVTSSAPQKIRPKLELRAKTLASVIGSAQLQSSTKSTIITSLTPENRPRPKPDDIKAHISSAPTTPTLKIASKRPRQQSDDEEEALGTGNDPKLRNVAPKRRPVGRKRPEPSIFIQPKRRKI